MVLNTDDEGCLWGRDNTMSCEWVYDDTHDKWDTECGDAFQFNDGVPIENNFGWCPFCGERLLDKEEE